MYVEVCFPFFDTRFARQDAGGDDDRRPAPLWTYGEPPPPLNFVGNFGKVTKWIPPLPYARCIASDLVRIQSLPPDGTTASMRVDSIDMTADQRGHARVSIKLDYQTGSAGLAQVAEHVALTEVAVRHPKRREAYERLADIGPDLADLYARESARTARLYKGEYMTDWVQGGRPFIIVANTRRLPIETDAGFVEVPLDSALSNIRLYFFPWVSSEGDVALPLWYFEAPRGGEVWRQPADAIEEVTAHYEELFLCSVLGEQLNDQEPPDVNFAGTLQRHRRRLSALLRKQVRHGVDLQAALRLLSDYDRSILKPRETSDFEAAILERVHDSIGEDIRFRLGDQSFGLRRMNVTITNTQNIINYGIMADNTISITNSMLAESAAEPELKAKLEELRAPLLEAAKSLPEGEAKALLKDYENFTEAALRENPPKELVKAQGSQILETVKKVAAYAAPVTTIVGAILGLLS